MDEQNRFYRPVKYVQASRISTGEKVKQPEDEKVCVIEEAPITIDVEGMETLTIVCTPIDRRALAVGVLYGAGIIESIEDTEVLEVCDDKTNTVRIRLREGELQAGKKGHKPVTISSGNAFEGMNPKDRSGALPRVGDSLRIKAGLLRSVYDVLRNRQKLFEACGGTHAAAIFDEKGKILSFAEDCGRHNALDKAIGKCLISGVTTAGRGVALTSRLSLEIVSRCVCAGIELIAAVSAPTSLAIDTALKCNITLCAFVREERATVFTHPFRILGGRG